MMDATQAAIIARDLFDVVRSVPPVFQLVEAQLIGGVWRLWCNVDWSEYTVRISDADGSIRKTIDDTHRYYGLIRRVASELRCGEGRFEILADRPLNHGHLVVCRVWFGIPPRRVWESEYRFCINEQDAVYTLDEFKIRFGGRVHYRKGRDDEHVVEPPTMDNANRHRNRRYRVDSFLR
jgi:hypothetical protein